jgi:hypothetical protein
MVYEGDDMEEEDDIMPIFMKLGRQQDPITTNDNNYNYSNYDRSSSI